VYAVGREGVTSQSAAREATARPREPAGATQPGTLCRRGGRYVAVGRTRAGRAGRRGFAGAAIASVWGESPALRGTWPGRASPQSWLRRVRGRSPADARRGTRLAPHVAHVAVHLHGSAPDGSNSPRPMESQTGRCAGVFSGGAANVFLIHHLTVVNCRRPSTDRRQRWSHGMRRACKGGGGTSRPRLARETSRTMD
jgi:hypothetical protein